MFGLHIKLMCLPKPIEVTDISIKTLAYNIISPFSVHYESVICTAPCNINLLRAVIVEARPFHPSLIFVSKVRAYPSGVTCET
jgi:hypothetical protein